MSNWLPSLQVNGYALIAGVFPKSRIDKLRAAVLEALTFPGPNIQWRGDFPALFFEPPHTYLDAMRARIAPIVQEVLGPNVLQLNNQYYFRLPGDGDEFAWHQDISFRTPPELFDGIETRYLQTAIIVDHMGPSNGGIEFIPGSHKSGDLALVPRDGSERGLREFKRGERKGVIVDAHPGDVLVWSVMAVHGSEPNVSHFPRAYYMNGFASSDAVKDKTRFPWYLREGRLA